MLKPSRPRIDETEGQCRCCVVGPRRKPPSVFQSIREVGRGVSQLGRHSREKLVTCCHSATLRKVTTNCQLWKRWTM
ncbi:hypothetical protein ACFPRL_08505 [Pseudoclavibacter helvolus]